MIATAIFFVALGCAVGSFGNVLIYRLALGQSVGGRSHCMRCKRILSWFDLVPVVSYVLLRARCRTCKAPIASQYPLVEIASGALFLIALSRSLDDQITALLTGVLLSFLLFAAVFDARHQRIPDIFTAVIGVLGCMIAYRYGVLLQALLGGIVAFVWFGGQWVVSQGKWVGEGDIFLGLTLGLWLGFTDTIAMIVLSYVIGTLVLVPVVLLRRCVLQQGRIAFVPFLAGGALLAFLGVGQWYLALAGF